MGETVRQRSPHTRPPSRSRRFPNQGTPKCGINHPTIARKLEMENQGHEGSCDRPPAKGPRQRVRSFRSKWAGRPFFARWRRRTSDGVRPTAVEPSVQIGCPTSRKNGGQLVIFKESERPEPWLCRLLSISALGSLFSNPQNVPVPGTPECSAVANADHEDANKQLPVSDERELLAVVTLKSPTQEK